MDPKKWTIETNRSGTFIREATTYRGVVRKRRLSVRFAWYDLWIGAYWDRKQRVLYVCPLPMLLITIGARS
jgi:hypothetical protein